MDDGRARRIENMEVSDYVKAMIRLEGERDQALAKLAVCDDLRGGAYRERDRARMALSTLTEAAAEDHYGRGRIRTDHPSDCHFCGVIDSARAYLASSGIATAQERARHEARGFG